VGLNPSTNTSRNNAVRIGKANPLLLLHQSFSGDVDQDTPAKSRKRHIPFPPDMAELFQELNEVTEQSSINASSLPTLDVCIEHL
jgi:hypothetical protein